MIGSKIVEKCPYWENFLRLRSIMDYCFAPLIHKDWPVYLETLVNDHHQEFVRLYPLCRIIPKQHYMIHYAEIILKLVTLYNAVIIVGHV